MVFNPAFNKPAVFGGIKLKILLLSSSLLHSSVEPKCYQLQHGRRTHIYPLQTTIPFCNIFFLATHCNPLG